MTREVDKVGSHSKQFEQRSWNPLESYIHSKNNKMKYNNCTPLNSKIRSSSSQIYQNVELRNPEHSSVTYGDKDILQESKNYCELRPLGVSLQGSGSCRKQINCRYRNKLKLNSSSSCCSSSKFSCFHAYFLCLLVVLITLPNAYAKAFSNRTADFVNSSLLPTSSISSHFFRENEDINQINEIYLEDLADSGKPEFFDDLPFEDFSANELWLNLSDEDGELFDEAVKRAPSPDELKRIQRFDPSMLNYTAIREVLDSELSLIPKSDTSKRSQRSLRPVGRLPRLLGNLGRVFDFETVINEIETSIMTSVSCNACRGGVSLFQAYIEGGKTEDEIVRAASKLCTNFKIETPRVCFGIIHLMAGEVVYVLQHLTMSPDNICGFLIGEVCGNPPDPTHQWRILFPPYRKPPPPIPKPPIDGYPTLKVLHLSDTHFDPYYKEGSNAECGEPMCCRATSGKPKNEKDRAGFWGDYRKCDTPLRTIKSMFRNIVIEHPDIDYIIWTGDLPPHDIWNQTKASNLKVLRETVQQLFDYFPNTPVYPALGNHESAPVNSFPPPSIPKEQSAQWLYDELDTQWRKWLPSYTSNTIRKGGFYSVEAMPGFRIISLNMNFCNNKNWWLLLDSQDPSEQLQWLVYELQSSELRGEKVHIIGHIPPGYHDCLKVWSQNFYNIVNRFESTITSQFYGHTHYDEFELFSDELHRATNVAYVAPSITTYYSLNPGYRLYRVEGRFNQTLHRVIDHETWIMNLDEANHPNNILRHPRWYPLYSARRDLGLRSLLPVDWDNLVHRMAMDDKLFQKFYRYYWKNSPIRPECDGECRKRILCDLKSGRSNARKITCAAVHQQIEAQERSYWKSWLFPSITVGSLAGLFMWG